MKRSFCPIALAILLSCVVWDARSQATTALWVTGARSSMEHKTNTGGVARHEAPSGATPSTLSVLLIPKDVASFIKARNLCDHFRGEIPDPPNVARMAHIEKETDRYCKGTDTKLASLKAKYKGNEAVQKALAGFDPRIED